MPARTTGRKVLVDATAALALLGNASAAMVQAATDVSRPLHVVGFAIHAVGLSRKLHTAVVQSVFIATQRTTTASFTKLRTAL